ncbi:LuxR family transcriptional regulator [Rhodococcus olei]|uniref:LuxR family transcriptional regulator n=1 Tax=Rhodococcus olei TaxID=2161675 RepID=A0ABP8P6Q2_9NOCA
MASAVRGRAGNLPLELTSFVGRRRELTEARRMLSTARMVTLTGIGGVGKTRLALRVAEDVQRTFPDGVWLVELAELHDPGLVADAVSVALGLRDAAQSPLALLTDHLAGRHALLVFDNCEHQVEPVAVLAAHLLRGCPELRILATSREPLGIGGEVVLRVPPLTVADAGSVGSPRDRTDSEAVMLFAERACTAVPGFGLTDANRAAVTRICQRLDGLPLPIELAVARLRSMSPEQILQRLTDRYRLLTLGSRGSPTRQQTLRMCVDWSHTLCTDEERTLWARLSVFAGGFELDAAEEVCGGGALPNDLLDGVASLVDKSILIREEQGPVVRYRLLETLADYGRTKLREAGDPFLVQRRHRNWCEGLVRRAEAEWIGPREVEWIARLGREQPNLRAAMESSLTDPDATDTGLRIAIALLPYWICRGQLREGRHWFGRLLAVPGSSPEERVTALSGAVQLAALQLDLSAAATLLAEGRRLVEETDSRRLHALITHAAGRLAMYGGDLPRAADRFGEALDVFRTDGDLHRQIWALQGLGAVSAVLGHGVRAVACHEEVVAITEPRGEVEYRARGQWLLALALWQQGERRRVSELLEAALRSSRLVDDRIAAAGCLGLLAWCAADEHRERRAAVLLGAAESQHHALETPMVVVPDLHAYHEECRQRVLDVLGAREFDVAVREGRDASREAAVAFALGERPCGGPQPTGPATELTRRERQVADLVAKGLTNRAIAESLVISQRTAEGHVERILTKLGFTSRAQIAAWAVDRESG